MSTLLLRLAAPLQSWGYDAKFERRGTGRTPTKSGVIGLAAAALGRRRDEPIDDLRTLRFGVRTDQEGRLLRDYHTVKDSKRDKSYVTHRQYIMDAVFLAGLEGDDTLLEQIDHALRNPAFPLYLGRRSCPPSGKISLGIFAGKPLLKALQEAPLLVRRFPNAAGTYLRIEMDADENAVSSYMRRDMPISFAQSHRQFGFRFIHEPNVAAITPDTTEHNPMLEWGE